MEYYPACSKTKKNLSEALESIGVNSSYSNREKIAEINGITNYTGSLSQNDTLFRKLLNGQLIKSNNGNCGSSTALSSNITESEISSDKMINKLENSSKFSDKKKVLVIIGNLLFQQGYEASFVAGVLGNIYHEGNIGKFESSAYTSNPNAEPAYLKEMDKKYNYRTLYSNKCITEVSLNDLSKVMDELKNNKWNKGKFGLGCVQWTGERTYTLFKLYQEECGNNNKITLDQATSAEGKMIIGELSGQYKNIYNDWSKSNSNKNTENAAYNAGSLICIKYEVPYDYKNKAVKRGNTAKEIYKIMTN